MVPTFIGTTMLVFFILMNAPGNPFEKARLDAMQQMAGGGETVADSVGSGGEDGNSGGLRTVKAPNHSFFENTWIETNTPVSGAILVNSWKDNADRDPVFSGGEFLPLEDTDSDGTLNFQDAFPLDAERTTDTDYDGIDDSEDSSVSQFSFDHSSFSAPNAIEVVTPSMLPRSTPVTPCPGGAEGSICWNIEQ